MAEKKDKLKEASAENLEEVSGGKINLNEILGFAKQGYDLYNRNRQSSATTQRKKDWYRQGRIDYKYQQFGHDQYTDLDSGQKISVNQAKALVAQRTGRTPDWN